ncbi:site-specific DNA-methyltransferase, partial [Salmonella enterica subsp. enterica serovar Infantis]|nr:site-specific DNA-methyltransferase [Salmonella enterica subsp. enterica serovar Infantis]
MISLNNKIKSISEKLGFCSSEYLLDASLIDLSLELSIDNLPDSILISGDNLYGLAGLISNGKNTIDVCYIDPPYNTGSKFLYHDKRKSAPSDLFGSHGAWMMFMLPRLICAKEMMKPTGVIAISIDDYEFPYLKILMDSVFGESNFIGNIVVCRSKNGKGSNKNIASTHEYL